MKAVTYHRVAPGDPSSALQANEAAGLVAQRGWHLLEQFVDEGRGQKVARPGFRALMVAARRRRFDVLVVYRVDRSFRSISEFVLTIDALAELEIAFVSATELQFDTTTRCAMLPTIATFAELERAFVSERTRTGYSEARRRGLVGRPNKLAGVNLRRARFLRQSGESVRAIARMFGVGVATVHRALVPNSPA